MKIGLVDVDGHNFPNLALKKIAKFYRSNGSIVEWALPMFGDYDKVYMSKVFSFSPDYTYIYNCEVEKGGTGYDLNKTLPDLIDSLQPDYSIYPYIDSKTAYGFLTRGCPNKCKWCVVPEKEGNVRPYMDIDDISQGGRRTKIILMDNNALSSDHGIYQLQKIAEKGYHIDLNQANSARLVNNDIAELFARIKWIGSTIRFAADTPKQIAEVNEAMERIDRYRDKNGKKPLCYLIYTMIYGDINECYERVSYWRDNKRVCVEAQPFRDFKNPNQVIPQWQKDMARWCNRREIWKSFDFKDFSPRKGFTCKEYFKQF